MPSTNITDAKNLSNVIRYTQDTFSPYWMAYRKDIARRRDQLWVGHSADGENWNLSELKESEIGTTPRLDNAPQLAIAGGHLYLFWMDDDENRLRATMRWYNPDTGQGEWLDYVNCNKTNGDAIKEPNDAENAVIAAVGVGENVLVSVLYGTAVDYYLFSARRDDYKTNSNSWKASEQIAVSINTINNLLGGSDRFKEFKDSTSMSFYSMAPNPADCSYLVQSVLGERQSGQEQLAILQLKLQPKPGGYGLPLAEGVVNFWKGRYDRDMSITNDPGGRLIASFNGQNQYPNLCMLDTSTFPAKWDEENTRIKATKNDVSPQVFFHFGDTEAIQVGNKLGEKKKVTRMVLVRDEDVDSITLHKKANYGAVRKIFRYETLNITEGSTDKYVYIQGYVDGPPPVFDGMTNPSSTVNYAKSSATENSFDTAINTQMSITTKGEAGINFDIPVIGKVGATASWERSFSMNAGMAFGFSSGKSIDENTTFQLEVKEDGGFQQKGLVRGSEIVATRDVLQFTPGEEDTPAQNTSEYSEVYLDFRGDTKLEYELGAKGPTVGDLRSYTRDAWNKRMKDSGLYPNLNDYIDDIVLPHAIAFQDGQAAVRDTWTPGSPIDGAFSSTSSNYLSASMTLKAKTVSGVSGEFMGNSPEVLVGFQAVIGSTTKSAQSKQFGLALSIDGESGGYISRYRVSTSFLKASSNWIKEFKYFYETDEMNVSIDRDAECWKIMYVVDQIEYNDTVAELSLSEKLQNVLKEKSIETTDGALKLLGLQFPEELAYTSKQDDPILDELQQALIHWDSHRNIYTRRG